MPALIFDCDGVLADTERFGHLPAFNQMFAEMGVPVQWSEDEYADLLRIGGGKERMASILTPDFVERTGLPTSEAEQAVLVATWHRRKTDIYTERVRSGAMPPRPGVRRLSEQAAAAGWQLAVASTSAEPAVRSVLVHAVGETLAESLRRLRRGRGAAQEACAGHLPARRRRAGRRPGPDHRRRGQSQRHGRGDSRPGSPAWSPRAATPATRTSPAPPSSSRAWASPRRRRAARSRPRCWPTRTTCCPNPSSTSRTLEALLQRAPRSPHSKDRVHEH